MGATHRADPRGKTLDRMLKLLDNAAAQGVNLVLFPETAFTTFVISTGRSLPHPSGTC